MFWVFKLVFALTITNPETGEVSTQVRTSTTQPYMAEQHCLEAGEFITGSLIELVKKQPNIEVSISNVECIAVQIPS